MQQPLPVDPRDWRGFAGLLIDIDRDEKGDDELRARLEQIASRERVDVWGRCRLMLPLLRPFLPGPAGTLQ